MGLVNPGPTASSLSPGLAVTDGTKELALAAITPAVARYELRRRKYSEKQVSDLESGDWSAFYHGPAEE